MFEGIGLGMGLLGSIGSAFSRGGANAELEKLNKKNMALAGERLGLAKTLFNARMPGASAVENNIFGNQATTLSTIQKGATDSGQVISGAGSVQGQTNDAFSKLGIEEAGDAQRRYGNLNSAYDDYKTSLNDEIGIKGAEAANKANTWQEFSNLGFGVADFSASGGFDRQPRLRRMPTEQMPLLPYR